MQKSRKPVQGTIGKKEKKLFLFIEDIVYIESQEESIDN